MEIKTEVSESDALTISKSAAALGINEFSLFARIQAGEVEATRLRAGEMAIPTTVLERLTKLPQSSLSIFSPQPEPSYADAVLGIKKGHYSSLTRNGEMMEYSVPGVERKFTESEIKGYRAAFGAIADEFQTLGELKKQLDDSTKVWQSPETEIVTPQNGSWQVRSTLLNLGQSDILLCQQGDNFAAIERFREGTPYAKANGNAEILLERDNPQDLAKGFNENSKHTLEFMASNQVATAQRVIWEQYPEHRPDKLVNAISERCRLAVAEQETISQEQSVERSNRQGRNRGMSI